MGGASRRGLLIAADGHVYEQRAIEDSRTTRAAPRLAPSSNRRRSIQSTSSVGRSSSGRRHTRPVCRRLPSLHKQYM